MGAWAAEMVLTEALGGGQCVIWTPGRPKRCYMGPWTPRWILGSLECWIVYQESMVPSCGAGCRLLATWILAGYQGTDCLVTSLSFDGSADSRNPMRYIRGCVCVFFCFFVCVVFISGVLFIFVFFVLCCVFVFVLF